VYLEFYNDYQRQNPFTKKLGIKRYLDGLKNAGNLSDNAYQIAIENIDKLNLMEIYYEISRGKIPIHHQSAMANAINYSISGKNMLLRKSSINNDIRESTLDKKEKQKYFDNQINLIFKPRQSSLESIVEEPEKYPMDTVDDETDTKDRLINAYNNPIAINMGLGPLPMDYNIYDSIPITSSKLPNKNENINVNNSINDLKRKDSKDIRAKIKNDINNYRNKNNKKEKNKNTSSSLTDSSFIIERNININNYNTNNVNNNIALPKNDYDSESKEININMPFKASIHQSQNTNTNVKSSVNSLDYKNKIQNKNITQDINKIPLDTTDHNINDALNNNNNPISNMDNTNNKYIPQDEVSNNNKENLNDISENKLVKDMSGIDSNKIHFNDNINLDVDEIESEPNLIGDKNNVNLSKSLNKENDNNYNNNEFNDDEE
jgi:hypothetical protein